MTRKPRLFKKFVFSIIPLLLVGSVLEIGSRSLCSHRFDPFSTNIAIQGNGRMSSDPETVWGNAPHYLEYDLTAQYNDFGMRVDPGDDLGIPAKGDNDFFVLLLGGSAMAGMGTVHKGEWMKITGIATGGREQSIDGFLETALQESMPGRTVRVFNAAVNCSTLLQSHLHYKRLLHLDPDWVISMDGYNDPSSLGPEQTSRMWVENFWDNFHYFHFPYSTARFLMSRSAFFYVVSEALFYKAGIISNTHETQQDTKVFERWLNTIPPTLAPKPCNTSRQRAVDEYFKHIDAFRHDLTKNGQRNLLLIQPDVTARKPDRLKSVEKAVYNYTLHYTGGRPNEFLADLHRRAQLMTPVMPELISMSSVASWRTWVFVDYCHFTAQANRRIAQEICDHIVSDGAYVPFSSDAVN